MIKKKAKSKTVGKKAAKKKSRAKTKKQLDPAEVRKEIAQLVDADAKEMAEAVIDEALKGQLATVKYLFEVAEIFPPSTDGSHATAEEDSLAKTLLHRLNIPETPVVADMDDEMTIVIGATRASEAGAEEEASGEKESGDEESDTDADAGESDQSKALNR